MSRPCAGECGTEVSGRRKRCPDCRRIFRAKRERQRYHASHGQDAEQYEHIDGEPVVDYSAGGAPRPNLAPNFPYRQNPRHDHSTRARMELQENPAEADMSSWNDFQAVRASGRYVDFPPAHASAVPDPLGRSVPRSRGLYSPETGGQLVNPAAAGHAYRPSPMAGQRALEAQKQGSRFGPNVTVTQVRAGQLASPPPTMVAKESAEVERQRIADDHTRSQAPSWRR